MLAMAGGPESTRGYGQLKISENPARYKRAHRLSYEIHNGPIAAERRISIATPATPLSVSIPITIWLSRHTGGQYR
jgi:hypothetical protein